MNVSIHLFHPNSNPVYNPEETIRGKVMVNYSKNINIREIRLKIRGKEKTQWGYGKRSQKSSKTFLSHLITLHGAGEIIGANEFPFSYVLPTKCPSTYQGKKGNIEYYFKAIVDIPWVVDEKSKLVFQVLAPIDFNQLSGLSLRPVTYEKTENKCAFCYPQGSLTMIVHLDKEAFVVGENIKIRIDINNMSNGSVVELVVELEMTFYEKSSNWTKGHKKFKYPIIRSPHTGVGAHGNKIYNLMLLVPSNVKIPNFDMCTLFENKYTLTVKAKMESRYKNLVIDTAITLGHIPKEGQESVTNENINRSFGIDQPSYGFEPPPAYS